MKSIIFILSLVSFSASAQVAKTCALAFNSLNPEKTSTLNILAGQSFNNLNQVQLDRTPGDWDNKITMVKVAQGCTFIGYQYQDFNRNYNNGRPMNGFSYVLENQGYKEFKTVILPSSYDNMISSLKCFCL